MRFGDCRQDEGFLDMSTYDQSSHRRYRRRVIQKTGADDKPFMPWGLLPVLGLIAVLLYGLFIFSAATVQDTARSNAQDALASVGADWAKVKASGQWITLEGNAPSRAAISTATNAIAQSTNNTLPFQIKARPVTRIIDKTTIRAATPAVVATPPARQSPVNIAPHNWTYTLDRGVLELAGEVPDQASHDAIISAAERRQSSPRFSRVLNNLTITGRTSDEGFTGTALRGINTLSQCDVGTASFTNTVFSLNCEADTLLADDIKREANAPLSYGSFGRIDVYSVAQANTCNDNLVSLGDINRPW